MSEEREEEEELRREPPPPPTQHRSARVPVPNSKFVEDRDDEEVVKIERKPRTKVGKRAKIKSSQLRAKKSFENLVNNNDDDEEEEEEPATTTTRLVQPSKILIPQDGQQPKKWRLADQRRYECKQFCVHVFKCDHVGNSSRTTLSLSVFSLFSKRRRRRRRRRANSLSLSRPRRDAFFLSFFLSLTEREREICLSCV